jgi:uncharacterized protein (DUF2147 family)
MLQTNVANCSAPALRAAAVILGFTMLAVPAAADPREAGIWYDDTGKGAVKIEICTPTTLCGKIYWLKEPMNAKGEPKTDGYNPEPSMRKRPICGLPVLGDLEQLSEGGFDNGWVYDPKEGKSYSVALDLVGSDELKVTGYKGMRFLGKSFIWTRAPNDLPSCSTDAASNAEKPNAEKPKDGKSKDAKANDSKSKDAKSKDAKAKDAKSTEAKSKDAKAKVVKAKDSKETASSTGKKATGATKVGAAGATTTQKKSKTNEGAATQQPPVASN